MYDSEPDTRTVTLTGSVGWVAGDFAADPDKEHHPITVTITWERSERTGEWHCVNADSMSVFASDNESTMTQTWYPLGAVYELPSWLAALIKQYAPKD